MRKLVVYPLIVVAGFVVGIGLGDGAVWTLLAGPPDMGRADFARTQRPANEFLACTADDPGCADPDLVIEPHAAPPGNVLAAIENGAFLDPHVVRVDDGSDPLHRRYVARTRILKFPDTITVDAVPMGTGTALRISSRSQIGESDFGVNEKRVRRWLSAL